MLKWKEFKNKVNDQVVLGGQEIIDALHNCGLLRFFMCPGMGAQPLLLQRLVAMWDTNCQLFMGKDQELNLEVEDIYFIMGLSQIGVTAMFTIRGEGGESVDTYVREYCCRDTQKVSGKVSITQVVSLSLQTILYTVMRITGSITPHMATKGHIQYAFIAMDGVVYNWCMGLLVNMKDQLTRCKRGQQKQFGYGSILASFFSQRVLVTQLYASLPMVTIQDQSMKKWSEVLSCLGGGRQPHFSEEFFDRFERQIWAIDDYGYAGIDFREDLKLALLEREDWDHEIGKKYAHFS